MVEPIPARGDIVLTNFSPTVGSEQSGKRPGVVLSVRAFNRTGLMLVCPITSKRKGFKYEVELPSDVSIDGVVLPFHVKTIDWRERQVTVVDRCPPALCDLVSRCIQKMQGY